MMLFLVPQTIGVALQLVSNTVTIAYLGRLIGARALAAASTFFPIFFLLTSFLLGLFSGGLVLVGQAHGAGDVARVRAVIGTTLCGEERASRRHRMAASLQPNQQNRPN